MGSIGALIGPAGQTEAALSRALDRSPHRGEEVAIAAVGDVSLGAAASARGDAWLHRGVGWSVALAGVVDMFGGIESPANPAESIARAMDDAGPSVLQEARGDFACVATDGRRLLAARDHLGTQGLFVGSSGTVAAVMSEPKQVVAALGRSRRPDLDGLVAAFFGQSESGHEPPSVVEGVDRVPRAAIVEVKPGGWRTIGRVWDPSALLETARLSVADAIESGWSVIEKAVARMTTANSAVGLSGGIDSTLIAAAARERGRPGAMSAVFPQAPSVDESTFIEATAKYLDIEVTTYAPNRDRLDRLDMWVDRFDGPTYGVAIGPVSEMNDRTAAAGYDTLLGGELAELVYDMREFALAGMLTRGRMGPLAEHMKGLRASGVKAGSIARLLVAGLVPARMGQAYTRRFRPPWLPAAWLDQSFMAGLEDRWAMGRPAGRRWADIQLLYATGPSYPGLEITTVMGDTAGVRTRRPLTDRDVWEFFLSLPPEIKFPDANTKSLVRMILAGRAPDEVVWRTDKTVFDEDSLTRAEYPFLMGRLGDGFRLPGVDYPELIRSLEARSMSMWELSMARILASIHSFITVAP